MSTCSLRLQEKLKQIYQNSDHWFSAVNVTDKMFLIYRTWLLVLVFLILKWMTTITAAIAQKTKIIKKTDKMAQQHPLLSSCCCVILKFKTNSYHILQWRIQEAKGFSKICYKRQSPKGLAQISRSKYECAIVYERH